MPKDEIDEKMLDNILKNVDAIASMAGAQVTDPVILELERDRMLGKIDPDEADFLIFKRIKQISAEESKSLN